MTQKAPLQETDEVPIDWRSAIVTQITSPLPPAYPGGPSFPSGSQLFASCSGEVQGIGQINFIAPSPVAMAMNISHSAAQEAEVLKRAFKFVDVRSPDGLVKHISSDIANVYDYLEKTMVAVFFAYQGIEAFCNDALMRAPNDSVEIKTKKGERKQLTRREAERQLSTLEKLGTLLPGIVGVPTAKGKAIWERFLYLQATRDEVVHFKNQILRSTKSEDDPSQVLVRLIADDPRIWPQITMELLDYFTVSPYPEWYNQLKKRV